MNARARETSVQYLIDAPLKGFSKVASTSLYSTELGQWSNDIMVTFDTGLSRVELEGERIFCTIPGVERVLTKKDSRGTFFLVMCNNITEENFDLVTFEEIKLRRQFPADKVLVDVSDRFDGELLNNPSMEQFQVVYPYVDISTTASFTS